MTTLNLIVNKLEFSYWWLSVQSDVIVVCCRCPGVYFVGMEHKFCGTHILSLRIV